jgi:hypothetical protein
MEEKTMSIKDYADVLRLAIKLQINYEKEEMDEPFADEEYLNGVITGLRIALEKIDASMFLAENK